MTLPVLSEAQIRQHTSEESFARGASYYHGGAVGPLVLRGGLLQAEVEGSQYEPYRVTVSLDAGGVRAAGCTCPYDWGGWCKHIVATLLAYAGAAPDDVEVRPPLAELLAGLDRAQLEALLLRLAVESPTLADRIDALAAALVAAPPAPSPAPELVEGAAPPIRRTTVDVTAFRQQIRRIFRGRRYDDYMAYESILAELEPLVGQIRSFIDGDDAETALLLLEALTADYSEGWVDFDDSDGELGGFFVDLGALWAEALLTADLGPSELEGWRVRLDGWAAAAEEHGCEGLNMAVEAAEEGWSTPWLVAALRGDGPGGAPGAPGHDPALLSIRLQVLERKGLTRDALHLAVAAGMRREQALLLVRLGRGAEAAAVGREHFHTAGEAFALAHALRERGDPAAALAIGEHGLGLGATLSPLDPAGYAHAQARARLAAWLVDLAASQGRVDLALRAGAEALRAEPELGLYRRLAELAGAHPELVPELVEGAEGGWPALRERLLASIRTSTGWQVSGRIDIFLHEGLIDDAIGALGAHPSGGDLARVMDAATATHPDWVIRKALASAEGIINPGDARHYDAAVEWLRRARAAYQAADRSDDWARYLQGLRAKHGRKYKLMELLNLLERPRR